MRIKQNSEVAKIYLTKNKYPFIYFELYEKFFGMELFYGDMGYLQNAPWDNRRFDREEYPINEETVNKILLEYRRFILPALMEQL